MDNFSNYPQGHSVKVAIIEDFFNEPTLLNPISLMLSTTGKSLMSKREHYADQ